ncbi:MAG: YifB family Mg chelatase-like AAA ATPase, partial [Candidatus Lindowbacteria bacterium]|nr:YifB family Mg chelatase-like AAA ATPase [Candidatus Lindowbacteria bacterium]
MRVDVEVDFGRGLPGLHLVGLPSTSVKESEERVRSAIRRSGFKWPRKRITVNLAPSDVPKQGSGFDLPIALSILGETGEIDKSDLINWVAVGELSLDGKLRSVRGGLNFADLAQDLKIKNLIMSQENAREAAMCRGIRAYAAENLREAVELISKQKVKSPEEFRAPQQHERELPEVDFSDVKGQEEVKRAALIAAAGGHNLIMLGPPGSGKTMIAKRIPSILPDLEYASLRETMKIHSVSGLTEGGSFSSRPPFRAPHHTTSTVALIGGGSPLRPGEVSLAHNGLLFLDELPEFRRDLLESLRQPLEDGYVFVSRARQRARFSCR